MLYLINPFRLAKKKGWAKTSKRDRKRIFEFLEQYLGARGWGRSILEGAAVDLDGPVPWYTYPAIRELERVVPKSAKVFEFGSGNSTLWWRQHAEQVISVEHDAEWFASSNTNSESDIHLREPWDTKNEALFDQVQSVLDQIPELETPLSDKIRIARGVDAKPFLSYVAELLKHPKEHFDVIIVDGMARSACARVAVDRLKPDGFIVFDNSDRDEYADAYQFLIDAGFARINYWGPGPINPYEWCTSIFTRSLDCFRGTH